MSASNVDQELGWTREEYKKIGVKDAFLRSTRGLPHSNSAGEMERLMGLSIDSTGRKLGDEAFRDICGNQEDDFPYLCA